MFLVYSPLAKKIYVFVIILIYDIILNQSDDKLWVFFSSVPNYAMSTDFEIGTRTRVCRHHPRLLAKNLPNHCRGI